MRFHKNPDNRMVQLLEVLVFVSHCLLHGSVLVLYPARRPGICVHGSLGHIAKPDTGQPDPLISLAQPRVPYDDVSRISCQY
jgi:hypothetical protein